MMGAPPAQEDTVSDRTSNHQPWRDPDRTFLGEQSQGGMGNHAGPELAFMRLLSWWLHRRAVRKDKRQAKGRSR